MRFLPRVTRQARCASNIRFSQTPYVFLHARTTIHLVPFHHISTFTMPAVTRNLRSSTRLSAAPSADKKKQQLEKTQTASKTKNSKKVTAAAASSMVTTTSSRKRKAEEQPSKQDGAPMVELAAAADDDEPRPKPAKKAKVSRVKLRNPPSL
ncbi:uncharacterized protein LY79DRAFT_399736 [Colletotrichum navitas]|uniref:Uncharacterized protein n=1 Tax=Colletotrichum navitas TaxID=681940 RepID=A0AAD8PQ45_9PEZI|nr:uncharacterized protein LY79DRAFT_399736 [Colletotrichum navitas]KAK1573710.1 hypothetical protein LY79DRAFT_399736 [Colletotrichum navitas]